MLAPGLLAALETANSAASLDGAQAHRCLLRHAKLFAVATRDLYRTRYKRLREIRGKNNRVLYNCTVRRDRMETRPRPTTVPAHMDIRPFTENQSSAVLLTRSTRWSDAHRIESQEHRWAKTGWKLTCVRTLRLHVRAGCEQKCVSLCARTLRPQIPKNARAYCERKNPESARA